MEYFTKASSQSESRTGTIRYINNVYIMVPPPDRRGAGFPSEGANRPHQTPAGAAGAGGRRLRHGEPAAGLRGPGGPGPQGRLQMSRTPPHPPRSAASGGAVCPEDRHHAPRGPAGSLSRRVCERRSDSRARKRTHAHTHIHTHTLTHTQPYTTLVASQDDNLMLDKIL